MRSTGAQLTETFITDHTVAYDDEDDDAADAQDDDEDNEHDDVCAPVTEISHCNNTLKKNMG